MEPSLRSSTQRGNECKLRKPEQAVHETVRRFVESLRTDVRISQYADLVYAGKKIEENNSPWYWLEPVPGGRTGFLVFLPGQQAVWTDEQGKVSFYVQVRVAEEIYKKKSVFLASMNKFDGLLRLEDAWLVAGQNQATTKYPFTQRWDSLIRFYSTQYKEDFQLQQGLRLELASFQSLSSLDKWAKIPAMMFLQGENAHKRLRVQLEETQEPAPAPAPAQQQQQQQQQRVALQVRKEPLRQRAMFVDDDEPSHKDTESDSTSKAVTHDESTAKAVAHEEHPDTYNLWIKGVKKGYAAVQDLDLSRELRLASKEGKDLFVKVEWNSEFNMYEIVSKA